MNNSHKRCWKWRREKALSFIRGFWKKTTHFPFWLLSDFFVGLRRRIREKIEKENKVTKKYRKKSCRKFFPHLVLFVRKVFNCSAAFPTNSSLSSVSSTHRDWISSYFFLENHTQKKNSQVKTEIYSKKHANSPERDMMRFQKIWKNSQLLFDICRPSINYGIKNYHHDNEDWEQKSAVKNHHDTTSSLVSWIQHNVWNIVEKSSNSHTKIFHSLNFVAKNKFLLHIEKAREHWETLC